MEYRNVLIMRRTGAGEPTLGTHRQPLALPWGLHLCEREGVDRGRGRGARAQLIRKLLLLLTHLSHGRELITTKGPKVS